MRAPQHNAIPRPNHGLLAAMMALEAITHRRPASGWPGATGQERRLEERIIENMRLITLSAGLVALQVSSAWAEKIPWAARTSDFGLTALGNTDVAPGAPATRWNILSVGLFCGTPKLAPRLSAGQIYFYLYGIGADRSATGRPLAATVTIDGNPTDLTFGFVDDVAVTAVPADFARRLMSGRAASVLVKDYNSPDPDIVVMDGAAKAIQSALQRCLR